MSDADEDPLARRTEVRQHPAGASGDSRANRQRCPRGAGPQLEVAAQASEAEGLIDQVIRDTELVL